MLIRLIKLCLWISFKFTVWVLLPIWKLVYRLAWKGTPQQLVMALAEDPQIVRIATENGLLHILGMYKQKGMAMANADQMPGSYDATNPVTQEDIEWAMFIQNYGENPQPDMVPEYFRYVIRGGTTGSCTLTTELPTAGALVALCQRHNDEWEQWRKVPEFLQLFKQALEWQHADPARPGWNDFYMVQWFILRSDDLAREIAERTKLPGIVGSTCTWMANSVAQQMPAFRKALERVGYEFPRPEIMAGMPHDNTLPGEGPRPADSSLTEKLDKLAGQTLIRATANQHGNRTYITFETPTDGVQVSADLLSISFREDEPC